MNVGCILSLEEESEKFLGLLAGVCLIQRSAVKSSLGLLAGVCLIQRSAVKSSLRLLAGMYTPFNTRGDGTVGLQILYRPSIGIHSVCPKVTSMVYGLPLLICGVTMGQYGKRSGLRVFT